MSDSAPVKNRLFSVIAQAKSAWCVDSGCSFMKFVVACFILRALPYDSDVFVVRSEIQGWGETGLHVCSACCVGGFISTLVTRDADMARQPAEVNVEV